MITRSVEELLGPLGPVAKKNTPSILYLEGDDSLLRTGVRVCIIGTRKPTANGEDQARQLAEYLVAKRATVVSGLALGIDTIAHRTAMACGGRTIAVLGTPLGQVNPPSNAGLQAQIGQYHLLVSQFAQGTTIQRANFPLRNRTMALLSDATIIVEAGETSGTLHQGYETLRLGRPLFIMNDVISSGLEWPSKMLEYGAIPIGLPTVDDTALFEALPFNLESSAQPAL